MPSNKKQLGVLILDKEDWLLPECGPGEAPCGWGKFGNGNGDCDGNGNGDGFSQGNGSGYGDGSGFGSALGIGYPCDFT